MDVESRGLSVRQTEELVRRLREAAARARRPASALPTSSGSSALRDSLATKVTINTARKGGRITIEYYDEDDLERLIRTTDRGQAMTDSVVQKPDDDGRQRAARPRRRRIGRVAHYTAESIQVLEGLEAVRRRPACTSARPTIAACTT